MLASWSGRDAWLVRNRCARFAVAPGSSVVPGSFSVNFVRVCPAACAHSRELVERPCTVRDCACGCLSR